MTYGPDLQNFLAAYFHDLDFIEGRVDERKIVETYVAAEDPETVRQTVWQLEALLCRPDLPWQLVEHDSNVYLGSDADARLWLTRLVELFRTTGG